MLLDESVMRDDYAEYALIGALAADPHAIAGTIRSLSGADFYHPNRGKVWDAARALLDAAKAVTPPMIVRQLAATGDLDDGSRRVAEHEMIQALSGKDTGRAHLLAEQVAEWARRREIARAVKRASEHVTDHPGDAAAVTAAVQAELETLGSTTVDNRDRGTLDWSQLLAEFTHHHDPDQEFRGIETPWPELNEMLGDLHAGRMYVIGGSPGDGKSTAALNIAAHAAAGKESVLVFSKEMPTVDVTGRIVARGAEIDLRAINSRRLTARDRDAFQRLCHQTRDYQLRVNADPISMSGIKRIARRTHSKHGLDLLVVDYLQLMTGDERGRSAEEEIARISTELKTLALELGIAVVVPAQLNRNPSARQDQRPSKADLRQSGRIEQDADVVILLWRQPVRLPGSDDLVPDPDYLTFIVDKNRHGPKGLIQLRWNGGYGAIG